jgi:hypothetical protein
MDLACGVFLKADIKLVESLNMNSRKHGLFLCSIQVEEIEETALESEREARGFA